MKWIYNYRKTPPPENMLVQVKGSDCFGEWKDTAYRLDYKKGSSKAQLKRKWRWMKDGQVYSDTVDAWSYIPPQEDEK